MEQRRDRSLIIEERIYKKYGSRIKRKHIKMQGALSNEWIPSINQWKEIVGTEHLVRMNFEPSYLYKKQPITYPETKHLTNR
jgi:hypothetical protein